MTMSRPRKTIRVIIDGDPMVYRAGFAGEESSYRVVIEDIEGMVEEIWLESADAIERYHSTHPGTRILERERMSLSKPLPTVLDYLDTQINSIMHEVKKEYGSARDYSRHIVLSRGECFRHKIARVKPYKGNRFKGHKPVYYAQLRSYIIDTGNGYYVDGREADDECSIIARRFAADGDKPVVCTIDKDLDQIPGLHYNYLSKQHYSMSDWDAVLWFYRQVLSGDIVDNVPGCWRISHTKADALIAGWSELSEKELWARVVECFARSQSYESCPYRDRDAADVALEMAQLVKMQEVEGQLWMPPGEPHKELPREYINV